MRSSAATTPQLPLRTAGTRVLQHEAVVRPPFVERRGERPFVAYPRYLRPSDSKQGFALDVVGHQLAVASEPLGAPSLVHEVATQLGQLGTGLAVVFEARERCHEKPRLYGPEPQHGLVPILLARLL